MNCNDSLNVTASIEKLLIDKLNDEISKKQLINQKLSPFLLNQVFTGKISQNFAPIVQNVEQKPSRTFCNKEIEVQPKSLQKDNMNPKNAQIQQGSSNHLKSQTKRLRRFTFSQKKTSILDINKPKVPKQIDQEHSNLHCDNINLNKTIEISSMPKLTRKLSKPKNEPIKLNMKKQSIYEAYNELESTLRQKKIRQEEERTKNLQLQELKNKRYQKLKQRFNIYQNKVETISFDFDGSIINLQDQQENHQQKPGNILNIQSQRSSQSRTFQTISVDKTQNFLISQASFNKNIHKSIGLPFQTIYKINPKDLNSIFNCDNSIAENNNVKHDQILSKSNFHAIPSSDQHSLKEWHLPLNSGMKKKSSQIDESVCQQMSLESSQNLQKKKTFSAVKVFRASSSGQKSSRKQKQAKILHEEGQKQFTNNFKRQTSTIPYLQITEGIRYQEEIVIKDDENYFEPQKVRFATIEKLRNDSQNSISYHQKNYAKSNLTFRSYLPLSQEGYQKSKQIWRNNTISVFSQQGKSFKYGFHRNQKKSQEMKRVNKVSKQEDEFAFFDNPNPIIIRDMHHNNNNTCRPRTTQTGIRMHENKIQSTRPFFAERNIRDTQILQMKQKMLFKQKDRIMSSHTARTIK